MPKVLEVAVSPEFVIPLTVSCNVCPVAMSAEDPLMLLKSMEFDEKVQVGFEFVPIPVRDAQLVAVVEIVTWAGKVICIIPELERA